MASDGDSSVSSSDRASESRDGTDARGPRCPFCEAPMYKRHCKYVCPQHGVIIDCSDPFR